MNYYRLFGSFEDEEGSFTEQNRKKLKYYHPQYALHQTRSILKVDECYPQQGMSDFLKKGQGFLASNKVQQIFFDQGFTGVQFLPVIVHNDGQHLDYSFMNPIAHYDLLDPVASEADDFSESLGGYKNLYKQIIDIKKLASVNIEHDGFTLSTYKHSYFVNETVKHTLEAAGITGVTFMPMEFSS